MSRRRPGLGLAIYVTAVIIAAAGSLAWELLRLQAAPSLWALLGFATLAVVLELMVVPLAAGGGAAASFAAYFAGLLVIGPALTAAVAASVAILADGIIRRRRMLRACFNGCHASLSLLASGWLYQKLGGVVGEVALERHWLPVMTAALCLWALEAAWVTAAVALQRGGRALRWLRTSFAPMATLDAALASVGLLLALLYQSRRQLAGAAGWQGALLLAVIAIIPSALLYYAYRLQGHLREAYARSLRALGALVEAKADSAQPGHSAKVADLAAALAEAAHVAYSEVEQVRYAGFLHDIGKVGVPSAMLERTRDQFAGESAAVRLHPWLGEQILSPIRFLAAAARMVRSHHERWDGLGYPDGLRREQIPLGARLLAIADAHVTMAETLTCDEVASRLSQAAGSRFDPRLVQTLQRMIQDHRPRPSLSGPTLRQLPARAIGESIRGLAWWR